MGKLRFTLKRRCWNVRVEQELCLWCSPPLFDINADTLIISLISKCGKDKWVHGALVCKEGREQWGLFQCSEHLCNGVVVCVIISLWRSPSLCKQAELMSPKGLGDKDRRPHDSLTVEFNPLISSEPLFAKYQSSRTLTSWLHLLIGWPFTYGSVFFKKHKHNRRAGANIIFYLLDNIKQKWQN